TTLCPHAPPPLPSPASPYPTLFRSDVQGGTFTITNPGGYRTFHGTPVISQPQAGILGTYALVKRPWVVQDDLGKDVIAIRPMMKDRNSTRLNSSHDQISYAVFCLKK